jgi:hypothetical protein
MAPLCSRDDVDNEMIINHPGSNDVPFDVFSNERFGEPLKRQLDVLQTATNPVSRRRKVTFHSSSSPTRTTIINPEREYYTDEDIRIKWWAAADLQDIRKRAKAISTMLRQNAKVEDCDLTMAHRKTTLSLARDYQSLVKLSPSTPDQDLAMWCSSDDGRRGLERFASKVYGSFRRHDVSNTRTAVIREQARQKFEGMSNPDAIAQLAQDASRRARTFAHFFGGADASQADDERPVAVAPAVRRLAVPQPILSRERVAPPRKRSKIFHPIDGFSAAA